MSGQMWTQTQRQNTITQLAQRMSQLTSRPMAELLKLATSLEEAAYSKCNSSQEQYVTILSKKIKKLEASAPGLAAQQANANPQQLQMQQQHLQQQQQLQLQQQQQRQQQLQQQNMLLQRQRQQASQQQQMQQQHQSQHGSAIPAMAQSMATSSNSQHDDMASMADMFLLGSTPQGMAASSRPGSVQSQLTATSQAQLQHMHHMSRQAQQAANPAAPSHTQLRSNPQQQQLYQQQLQLRQQQIMCQQQQQQQQMQASSAGGFTQPQQQMWSQPMSTAMHQVPQGQPGMTNSAQMEQEQNQRNLQQFWGIQDQLRVKYFPQLQQLQKTPLLQSPLLDKKYRDYISGAYNVAQLIRGHPQSIAALGPTMTTRKLEQVRTLYQNLETGLKSVRAGMARFQQELSRAEAQRQQGQTPSGPLPLNPQGQSMSLPSPLYLNRPDTPGAITAVGTAAGSAAVPTNTHVPAAPAASTVPTGFAPQPNAAATQVGQTAAKASAAMLTANAQGPPVHASPAVTQQQNTAAAADLDQRQVKGDAVPAAVVKAEPTSAEVHPTVNIAPPGKFEPQATALKSPAATSAAQQTAPSLVSALTTASPVDPTDEALQSLLDDGDALMPQMPAELQAELMSSASSSFTGIATFGTMPQQLSTTFGNGTNILTDSYAAELLSSPKFGLKEDPEATVGSGLGQAVTSEAAVAAAASVAAVNAAVASSCLGTAAFNAATGAALSRSQTAPPSTLLNIPSSEFDNPTVIPIEAGTAFLEELAGDPSSPASTATGMPGLQHQSQVLGMDSSIRDAASTQSAPPMFGLRKRRMSDSALGSQQAGEKRSRAQLAHVEAAIQQARAAFMGTATLEAADSLSHQDCIMLTCTPCGCASSADSADSWRAITLRLTSAYPAEPPSLVVRTSKDSPHAPQGETLRSVLQTSLSTLPYPPSVEGILRCWLGAVQSVETVFSSQNGALPAPGLMSNPVGHASMAKSQGFHMLPVMPQPAVIPMGPLAPLPMAPTAAPGFPPIPQAGVVNSLLTNTAAAVAAGQRALQKQLSGGSSQLQGMVGALQLGMAANAMPTTAQSNSYIFPPSSAVPAAPAALTCNHMGSIASLVSAGLLPQSHPAVPSALPVASLGQFSALLDMPVSNGVGSTMHATPSLFHLP